MATIDVDKLVKMSHEAKEYAYCPYSNYPVGAALQSIDGEIFTGCNVEIVSGEGICAERTAVVKAVSSGHKKFLAIAVAGKNDKVFITPCGLCRQFMAEFGLEIEVYATKPDLTYKKYTLDQLLPDAFVTL